MGLSKFTGSTLMDGTEKSLFKIVGTTMKHFAAYVYLKALQAGESIRLRVYNKVDDVSQWKFDGDVLDSVGSNNGTITNIGSWVSQWKFDGDVLDSIGSNNGTITYNTNLKRLYKFESNLNDSTTNAANGTLAAGTATYVTGQEGKAFSFDGSSYITASDSGLPTGNTAASISCWIKPSTLGANQFLVAYGTLNTNQLFGLRFNSGNTIDLATNNYDLVIGNRVLQQNIWNHVVGTWDGTTAKVYINGVLDNSGTPASINVTLAGASGLVLGAVGAGIQKYTGTLDEARVYNVTLSQAQVSALYMNGKFAQSHTFDNGELVITTDTGFTTGNGSLSISAWVKPTNLNAFNAFFQYGVHTTTQPWYFQLDNSGKIRVTDQTTVLLLTTNIVPLNQWTHVAVTYDGTTIKAYINGVVDPTTGTPSARTITLSGSAGIGTEVGGTNVFTGQIDEVRFYTTALSASQVLGLYNYTGSNYVTPLPVGNALSLDGSSYVTVTNQTPYNFERTNNFSISGWLKTTSNTLGIITKDNGDGTKGYQINLNASGKITIRLVNTASTNEIQVTDSGTAINDGNWHNFILTYSGTSLASGVTLYIDGVSRILTTNTNNLSATIQNTNNIIIGANGDASSKFIGLVDEVQIWNYVISSVEINAINAGRFANTHPIGLWHFDGGLYDYSGQGSTGNPTGTMTYVTGALSGSYNVPNTHFNFDGSEYIDVGTATNLQFEWTDPFSISCWVNTTVSGTNTIVSNSDSGYIGYIFRLQAGGLPTMLLINSLAGNYIDVQSGTLVNDGLWHHVVVTYNGTGKANAVNIYVDGIITTPTVLQDTLTKSIKSTKDVFIGTNPNNTSDYFEGRIDDLRIYNRALSSAEVSDLFTYPDSEMKSLVYDKTYSGPLTDAKYSPMLQGNQFMITAQQTGGTNRIISWEREESSG